MAVSDADLDGFRSQGDALLDPMVRALATGGGAVGRMLGSLFRSDRIGPEEPGLLALADAIADPPVDDGALVEDGQRLFQLYGPEVLLILGCYSLPTTYAAANGVQVVYRARRLKDDARRRLCETAQMVINVMQTGALAPGGIGTRTAKKVRIMHALVREHLRGVEGGWPTAFGEPINQEDLAGTLMAFSLVVLDGLSRIGVVFSPRDETGYLAVWRHVARILGIDPRLCPSTLAEARALAVAIGRRQMRPSGEGRTLARHLVDEINGLFPIRGYGLGLVHFFLDGNPFGIELAEVLDLPKPNWAAHLVHARAVQKRFMLRWLARIPGAKRRRRWLARIFTQQLILLQRPDKNMPFEIPQHLRERWG
jgi:hypothetical protein